MATQNSIYICDSNRKEIPDGGTARAGDVYFTGTTKANEKVDVTVGNRRFSTYGSDGQFPLISFPLEAGSYTARYSFEYMNEEQSRDFTLT